MGAGPRTLATSPALYHICERTYHEGASPHGPAQLYRSCRRASSCAPAAPSTRPHLRKPALDGRPSRRSSQAIASSACCMNESPRTPTVARAPPGSASISSSIDACGTPAYGSSASSCAAVGASGAPPAAGAGAALLQKASG